MQAGLSIQMWLQIYCGTLSSISQLFIRLPLTLINQDLATSRSLLEAEEVGQLGDQGAFEDVSLRGAAFVIDQEKITERSVD